mmetsp:Transcript_40534/g.82854  ORF Transcript_40534/g.82854 Transcript_40534/m.82854 type:complete len:126 (-) Transcript_40534:40-417(-)
MISPRTVDSSPSFVRNLDHLRLCLHTIRTLVESAAPLQNPMKSRTPVIEKVWVLPFITMRNLEMLLSSTPRRGLQALSLESIKMQRPCPIFQSFVILDITSLEPSMIKFDGRGGTSKDERYEAWE